MFHQLLRLDQLHDGLRYPCRVAGHDLLLLQEQGQLFIVDRYCPHQAFLLDNARVDERLRLTCPRHGYIFQLGSGHCLQVNCTLRHHVPRYDGNTVGVEL